MAFGFGSTIEILIKSIFDSSGFSKATAQIKGLEGSLNAIQTKMSGFELVKNLGRSTAQLQEAETFLNKFGATMHSSGRIVQLADKRMSVLPETLARITTASEKSGIGISKFGSKSTDMLKRFGKIQGMLMSLGFTLQMIGRPLQKFFSDVLETFKELGGQPAAAMNAAMEMATVNFKLLSVVIGARLAPVFEFFANIINRIIAWFLNLSPTTQKFIAIIGLVVAALTVLGGVLAFILIPLSLINVAFLPIIAAILLVVGVIIILIAAWYAFKDKIIMIIQKVVDKVKAFYEKWIKPIFDKVGEIIGKVKDKFVEIFNKIKEIVQKVFQWIYDHVIVGILESEIFKKIKNVVKNIIAIFQIGLGLVLGIWMDIFNKIQIGIVNILNHIIGVIEGFINAFIFGINILIAGLNLLPDMNIAPLEYLKAGRLEAPTTTNNFGDIIVEIQAGFEEGADLEEMAKKVGEIISGEINASVTT
jgi:phage-related protein